MANVSLQKGAVVIIDALGFQGIWRRYNSIDVVSEMQRLCDATIDFCTRARRAERAPYDELLKAAMNPFGAGD